MKKIITGKKDFWFSIRVLVIQTFCFLGIMYFFLDMGGENLGEDIYFYLLALSLSFSFFLFQLLIVLRIVKYKSLKYLWTFVLQIIWIIIALFIFSWFFPNQILALNWLLIIYGLSICVFAFSLIRINYKIKEEAFYEEIQRIKLPKVNDSKLTNT